MSWRDYAQILGNPDLEAWAEAADANPNTPADALKVALLQEVIDRRDIDALERFCETVVALAEHASALEQMLEEAKTVIAIVFDLPEFVSIPQRPTPAAPDEPPARR